MLVLCPCLRTLTRCKVGIDFKKNYVFYMNGRYKHATGLANQ